MNYDRDQLTEPNQMDEPDQIDQNQAMHEEHMADDDDDVEMEQEPQLRRSTRSRQPSRRYFSGPKTTQVISIGLGRTMERKRNSEHLKKTAPEVEVLLK
ncbi:hypothetical protein MTR_3g036800 [Medicago truncatula]|uniref:Uncharacterized protein n=1 Tax=Medicago truncatula TaxID=3880 RepID=A0A072V5I2_MEDTR|nr:hypothetical protein MTR_3g036800 [Medicago truncatula]